MCSRLKKKTDICIPKLWSNETARPKRRKQTEAVTGGNDGGKSRTLAEEASKG